MKSNFFKVANKHISLYSGISFFLFLFRYIFEVRDETNLKEFPLCGIVLSVCWDLSKFEVKNSAVPFSRLQIYMTDRVMNTTDKKKPILLSKVHFLILLESCKSYNSADCHSGTVY